METDETVGPLQPQWHNVEVWARVSVGERARGERLGSECILELADGSEVGSDGKKGVKNDAWSFERSNRKHR